MDYQASLYDPIYNTVGVPAVLTLSTGDEFPDLTVLDKSAGVDTGEGTVQVQTMKPGAVIRAAELAANEITLEQLQDAVLFMSGFYWTVTSYRPAPAPTGEAEGEVVLLLKDKRTDGRP